MKNTHPYFRPKEWWLWVVGTVTFAMYSIICLLSGASLWGMIGNRYTYSFYLVVPGMALQQWTGPKQRGVAPMLWMLYGCSFFVALVCFCVRLQLVWILQLLPPVVSAIFLWLNRNKIPKAAVQIVRKKAAARMVALWGCLCLLFALFHSAQNPHPIVAESVSINRDLLWKHWQWQCTYAGISCPRYSLCRSSFFLPLSHRVGSSRNVLGKWGI